MSFLRRPAKKAPPEEKTFGLVVLGDYRQETTVRTPQTGVDRRNYPTNFVSDMILEQVWDRESASDRAKVALYDPQGFNMTFGVASAVWDPWFKFVAVDSPSDEIMQDVQAELTALQAKKWLTLALAFERSQGNSWMRVVPVKNEDYRVDTVGHDSETVFMLDVFNPENAVVKTKDSNGKPTVLELTVSSGTGEGGMKAIPEPADDFILFRTRPFDRSHRGLPATAPAWDYMTYLRLIFNSISNYAQKIGLGAFIIHTKVAMSTELKTAMIAMAKDLSTNRYALVDGRLIEKFEFQGAAASSVNFGEFIDAMMDQVAAGAMIPKAILTGTAAGAITGSEVNSKEAYATIAKIQSQMEPYIRELVRRLGYEQEYAISWNTRYASDEKEQAAVEVSHVSAQATRLKYMTMNEVRALDDLAETADGDKSPAEVKDFSIGVSGFEKRGQTPEQQGKNRNPGGSQT